MKNFRRFASLAILLLGLSTASNVNAATTDTFYHWDALGSPVAATDSQGQIIWREDYKPYGEKIRNQPAAQTNSRWYAGHPHDNATGLSYMGARWYDPVVGRFMADDPQQFTDQNPNSFNRYAYGNNNPYRFVDPNGEYAEDIVLGVPSLAVGTHSLWGNLKAGNWGSAALDVFGIGADIVAIALPGVPGGAGLAIKAGREGTEAIAKKVPNPHGSHGGPAHTSTIERRVDELKGQGHEHLRGGKLPEEVIQTPGGCKSCRRPDITTRAPDGTIYRENVGRSTGSGNPIARERRALDDIEAATGRRPGFTPYDR